MVQKVTTYLMFQGDAPEALALYKKVFPDSTSHVRPGDAYLVEWQLAGHDVLLFNSPPIHDFSFTPSISLFVDFEDADAQQAAFDQLSEGGQIMMPMDDYGFSQRFAWIADQFGVSWQLNLP